MFNHLIGVIGLFGLSAYAFMMSRKIYGHTFLISGQKALRWFAVLAFVLGLSRTLVALGVMTIKQNFNFSGILLVVLLGYLLLFTRREG